MMGKSSITQLTRVGLVTAFIGLLVFTGVTLYSQEELLTVQESSSPVRKRSHKAGKPHFTRRLSPQAEFVAEVDKVVDTLGMIEDTLLIDQSPNQEFAHLSRSHRRIKKISKAILEDFDNVRWYCEQAALPEEIILRCDIAQEQCAETLEKVFDAIELVLRNRKPRQLKKPQDGVSLLNRIRKSLEVLTALKLKKDPDLYNSRPTIWEVQQAEAMPEEFFDPNAPSVNVIAEAAATPPVPDDLGETIDVQITNEIIEEANELGYSAGAIYEFVRNECEFQPYFGSRKGSVETLWQRSGNDYDLASLLIALLRSSGFEARYATGIVEMPVDRAISWLGVYDGEVAGSILTTMGLEGVSMWDGPELVAVRCRRVWVEAYVSRGRGGKAWVPLDPAFKLHSVHQGIDIPAEMGLDAQTFVDEYYEPSDPCIVLPREETPLDLLIQDINNYLAVYHPNETVESVIRTQKIVPENLGLLPASLPYKVLSRDSSFSEIPADKVYQVRFHLYDGGTTFINKTFDLPEIAGKRVTISYVGATPADQNTIDSYDGLLNTPPYLVDVVPVLKVAGQTMAVGASSIGAGVTHNSDIHFLAPVDSQGYPQNMVPSIYNNIIAGEYQAVCLSVHGTTNPFAQPEDPCDTEGFMAQLRYATGMGYLTGCIAADDKFGEFMHCKVVTDVDDAILQDQVLVTFDMWGDPLSWQWQGLTVDADRKIIGVWKVDEYEPGCGGEGKEIMVLGGAEGSLYESLIFEDSADKEAVSTIKILELAADQGITIYKRWDTLPLPANTLPTGVQNAISSSISAGRVVTFPASQITHHEWTGCGYIDMDDCTGAAGYIISGGQNGGSTVVVWFDWLFVWSSKAIDYIEGKVTKPAYDSPHPDALYAKTGWFGLDPYMYFEYQLRPVFEGGTTGSWRNYTSPWYANFQFQFLPAGHYTARVGDQGPEHKRKVTIFRFTGKLTPQDNFGGRSQAKYGIEEVVKLTSTITPSDLTAAQIGGLQWSIQSGVGTLSNVTNNGTATYDAGASAGNVKLRLAILSGPHTGVQESHSKTLITPSSAYMVQAPGTGIWHMQNTASAGFKGHIYLEPKDVSFTNIFFSEGTCKAIASGFYAYQNNDVHRATVGHASVSNGNSSKGCRVLGTDKVQAAPKGPPYSTGDFLWPIPWRYKVGTSSDVPFYTANHHKTADATGKCCIEKAGAGPFCKNAADTPSGY